MNKGSRGMAKTRAYGKMLVVAFGLAVMAVMVVHKLRERRILNLIVEDKDQQLISIHLLLQREMDLNKEMSKKIDDLRPRLHMLRSQKIELNGRVKELQSTIASLKDDIKVMESNLHMKNEENKILKDKITEILKEKDTKIEQLKQVNAMQLLHHHEDKAQSMKDQFLNHGVNVDVKRLELVRNVEDVNGQGQVGNVTKSGIIIKLEAPNESKHETGLISEDHGKRIFATGGAKGKKLRHIARNKRMRSNAMATRTKEVLSNVEFKDAPNELIIKPSMESMTNGTLVSNNDADHGDFKGVSEDVLQDSEANESGNGSSESESEKQGQGQDDVDDDDRQETDTKEGHTNEDIEEEEET